MINLINNLVHIADIFAIPGFILAFIYFYKIKNRNYLELFLLIWSLFGIVLDTLFTCKYLINLKKS